MRKARIVFWTVLVLAFIIPPLAHLGEGKRSAYMPPRFPKEVLNGEPSEAELRNLARIIAHQTSGNTRLGSVLPGQKVLIVLSSRAQDMKLLKAVIAALKERAIIADSTWESDLVSQALGIEPRRGNRGGGGAAGPYRREQPHWENGWVSQPWPRFLPEPLRKEVSKIGGAGDRLFAAEETEFHRALRHYVMELHPEYDAVLAGCCGGQEWLALHVGKKWKSLWQYDSIREVRVSAPVYPTDVWRLTEDKIMQTIPWIEEVHIYDPEGTDLRFSVTEEDAGIWAKGAYLPNHLFLYPLQGSRGAYVREGIRRIVVPKTSGVIAATHSHMGVFPNFKIYIKNGIVTHVEGGGNYKRIWDAYLANPQLTGTQVPLLPEKGTLYLFEISWGANPKIVRDYYQQPSQDIGRSGVFHWGFGVETVVPEVVEFMKERNLPNTHGNHLQTYFTTYEVKVRGSNQWIKFVDRGRLYHLDDVEVRALASRYGDPDEVLKEKWVPEFPGINVPGNYMDDYGKDPAAYVRRMVAAIEKGTYTHLQ